jgi:tetratricopeptide (TPR) repeat protein
MRFGLLGNVDQFRGSLAVRLGLLDDAENWFRADLECCERQRCPVEAGRNLRGLADVAEARGETREALKRLNQAIALLQQHGARLYLDQAIAMEVRLQGISSSTGSILTVLEAVQVERPDVSLRAAPDGTVTISFESL